MGLQTTILTLLMRICRFNFGTFEIEEFKKFLRMGIIFALIIGIYWTLRPLKDSIFIQLADKMHLPFAKTISVVALLPLVMLYTQLLEKTSLEKVLIILPSFYGMGILLFSLAMFYAQAAPEAIVARPMLLYAITKFLAYLWYFFVESFGSLMVALFWAFATNTTDPNSAKKGFPLVVMMGQIGGVVLPYNIGGLPDYLGFNTDTLSMSILGILTLSIILLVRYFLKVTPTVLLSAYQEQEQRKENNASQETGFLEGLKLLFKYRYLMGIFAANFIYEFIVTIFDFNFKIAAGTAYHGVALSQYLSLYGSSVNIVSLACLLLGISNITRFLGIGVALASMPIIVGAALLGFLTIDSLNFLFILMVSSKAFNYALNSPALKQLYIPTTPEVRFKAQAWIETFGSRASKEAASLFNMLLRPLQFAFGTVAGRAHYLMLSGAIGFPLLVIWLIAVLYLAKKFYRAVQDQKVIC